MLDMRFICGLEHHRACFSIIGRTCVDEETFLGPWGRKVHCLDGEAVLGNV